MAVVLGFNCHVHNAPAETSQRDISAISGTFSLPVKISRPTLNLGNRQVLTMWVSDFRYKSIGSFRNYSASKVKFKSAFALSNRCKI